MVAELKIKEYFDHVRCSLAKISMVAEQSTALSSIQACCSLAKISMVAEQVVSNGFDTIGCSLAKISMVAEQDMTA